MPETLEQRLDAADARLIRNEAVSALTAEGAISPRIAEIYLQDVEARIDPKTGEVVGVREGVAAWKASHADFFAQPTQDATTTSQTASTGTKKATVAGLPDLHGMSIRDRRAAVEAYRTSLRRASRGGNVGSGYQG